MRAEEKIRSPAAPVGGRKPAGIGGTGKREIRKRCYSSSDAVSPILDLSFNSLSRERPLLELTLLVLSHTCAELEMCYTVI